MANRIALAILYLVFIGVQQHATAQAGFVDPSFKNVSTNPFGDSTRFNESVRAILVQPDHNVIFGGEFTSYNGVTRNRIVRTDPSGNYDPNFVVASGFSSGYVGCLALQTNGKIIAGGTFTTYNGQPRNRLVRILSNGTIDSNFDVGTGFNNEVKAIAVQTDGKIIVVGNFSTYDGASHSRIVRLDTSGLVDPSFNTGTGFNNNINAVLIQSDGKIVIGGVFSSYNGTTQVNDLCRLNSDGTLDNAFTANVGSGLGVVTELALGTDGDIIIGGGNFTQYNGVTVRKNIARIDDMGLLDSGFSLGIGFDQPVNSLTVQADNSIIVGGQFSDYDGVEQRGICRITENGNLDQTFLNHYEGVGTSLQSVYAIAIETTGNLLIGGDFTFYNRTSRNFAARLYPSGWLHPTLTVETGFNPISDVVKKTVALPDGKILVGGSFYKFDGTSFWGFTRLHSDGSIDTSFAFFTDAFQSTSFVNDVVFDSINQKIYIGGNFGVTFTTGKHVARLNYDGTLDNTFSTGLGFDGYVNTLELQPDGKILAGGLFTTYDGIPCGRIARLDANGTLDPTFAVNTGTGYLGGSAGVSVDDIALQADGKIVVGGLFVSFNSTPFLNLNRLNSDGTADMTFGADLDIDLGNNNRVNCIAMQDDKILVGGNFNELNGVSIPSGLCRVLNNGSFDTTFGWETPQFQYTRVYALLVQPNNMILLGGDIYGTGVTCNGVMRLTENGLVDAGFHLTSTTAPIVYSLTLQPNDDKILVGGSFDVFDGYYSAALVRLHGGEGTTAAVELNKTDYIFAYPNPAADFIFVNIPKPAKIIISDILGRTAYESNLNAGSQRIAIDLLPDGFYSVCISMSDQSVLKQKLVVSKR